MSVTEVTQAAELLEALIRHAMAEHAAIKDRGFDSAKARNDIQCQIDAMYDRLADLRLEAQVAS